jgi:hypothetical protein
MTTPKKATTTRGRGRPPHQPTPATRRQVAAAAGGGMRHEDIALALGIHVDTLGKWYGVELSTEAARKRLEVLNALFAAAKRGNTSAAKAYLANEPRVAAPPAPADIPGVTAPPAAAATPAAPAREGKKAAADTAARTVHNGTGWEGLLDTPPAGPVQ